MKKKSLAAIFCCISLSACMGFGGCGKKDDGSITEISIPAITVDLRAPENKADVPADVKSEVFDASGRKLDETEWLLNSKFSKAYIRSLGAGEYTFTYKTEKTTGIIRLTVTDTEKPAYVFVSEIPETIPFYSSIILPKAVKDQDSYQDDYEATYTLTKDGEIAEFSETENGYEAAALKQGEYVWTATIVKNDVAYEYSQSFIVGTFEAWLKDKENELWLDKQSGSYLQAQGGTYEIDTFANNDMFSYTIENSVLQIAMAAGKTKVRVEALCDKIVDGGEEGTGTIWLSNNWKGYVWAFSGAKEYDKDDSAEISPRISGMKIVDGKFNYYTTGFLRETYFSAASKNLLQLDFANKAKVKATVKVSFE